jgi:hypothetical protein
MLLISLTDLSIVYLKFFLIIYYVSTDGSSCSGKNEETTDLLDWSITVCGRPPMGSASVCRIQQCSCLPPFLPKDEVKAKCCG